MPIRVATEISNTPANRRLPGQSIAMVTAIANEDVVCPLGKLDNIGISGGWMIVSCRFVGLSLWTVALMICRIMLLKPKAIRAAQAVFLKRGRKNRVPTSST